MAARSWDPAVLDATKRAFVEMLLDGKPVDDIAKELGIAHSTAYLWLKDQEIRHLLRLSFDEMLVAVARHYAGTRKALFKLIHMRVEGYIADLNSGNVVRMQKVPGLEKLLAYLKQFAELEKQLGQAHSYAYVDEPSALPGPALEPEVLPAETPQRSLEDVTVPTSGEDHSEVFVAEVVEAEKGNA